MNNYLKGLSSLLDIYATQRPALNIKSPSWDDVSALNSDWEKISKDLKISILKYILEIANFDDPVAVLESLTKGFKEYLNNLEDMHKLLSHEKIKNIIGQDPQLLKKFEQNIKSQSELLEKVNQKLTNERRKIKEKKLK